MPVNDVVDNANNDNKPISQILTSVVNANNNPAGKTSNVPPRPLQEHLEHLQKVCFRIFDCENKV